MVVGSRCNEISDVSVSAGVRQEHVSAPDLPLARDRDGGGDSPALRGLVDEGDDRSRPQSHLSARAAGYGLSAWRTKGEISSIWMKTVRPSKRNWTLSPSPDRGPPWSG